MSTEDLIIPNRRIESNSLSYGAIHPFPLPGWGTDNMVRLKGQNWQIIFKPDGAGYIDMERGGKIVDHNLEGPNVFIGGIERYTSAQEATKILKPVIDSLRGLLLLAGPAGSPILLPPVWEGVFEKTSEETITYEVGRPEAFAIDVTQHQLEQWGTTWKDFDPLSAAPEIHFGLRWYYKGMMSLQETGGDRIDAFVSFWVCIITIVRAWHAQNIGGDPPETKRIREFASKRMGLENEDLETFVGKFHDIVNNRRNELFKGGGSMVVTEDEVKMAAKIAKQVLEVSRPS